MILSPRFDKVPASVFAEPSFRACQYVLPVGVVATTFASVCVYLFLVADDKVYNLLAPIGLASWFFLLWQIALPRVRKPMHLDFVVLGLLAPVILHFTYLAYSRGTSETCAGIVALVLVSAILFRATFVYFAFSFASLSVWVVGQRLSGGEPVEARTMMYLYLMAPIMIFVLRRAWIKSIEALVVSKKRQQEISNELSQTIVNLEKEKRLRQQSENQLLHAQKMESLGLLAGGVAHDFNNFLMGISALAETLVQNSSESETLKSAGEIKEISQTAATVCRQMLTYSGRSFEPHRPLNVRQLLTDMRPLLGASIPKNVELIVEENPDEDCWIQADSSQIQQALLNLVTNSGQSISERLARRGRGFVKIRIGLVNGKDFATRPSCPLFGNKVESKEYVSISVEDNGEGIAASELSRIFDPYYTSKESGHGLGLSVTLGIAASHGGSIQCQSQKAAGTTIELLIPSTFPETETDNASVAPQATRSGNSIVIVDDEPVILRSLSRLLSHIGWEVTTVENGESLLQLLELHPTFDAVLLDYSMPGMNGLETLSAMRHKGIEIPTILCSGFMMPEKFDLPATPDAFIQKPYQLSELRSKLERLLTKDQITT